MIGKTIDKYKILKELGEGGMGKVYLAEHITLGKKYALKVLIPRFSKMKKVNERFLREAKAQALLDHPNLVQVVDYLEYDRMHIIVSKYIEGTNLSELMEKKKAAFSMEEIIGIMEGPISALNHAHSKGVIHRDIKPSNILIDKERKGYISDFGIARIIGTEPITDSEHLGTPHYMSPEQSINPRGVDHRSDIYSIGCILYEMASCQPPFGYYTDLTTFQIIQKHIEEPPRPLSEVNPSISKSLIYVVEKCLAKKPEDRFDGCSDLLNALIPRAESNKKVEEKKTYPSHNITQRPESNTIMTYNIDIKKIFPESPEYLLFKKIRNYEVTKLDNAEKEKYWWTGASYIAQDISLKKPVCLQVVSNTVEKNPSLLKNLKSEFNKILNFRHSNFIGIQEYFNELDRTIVITDLIPQVRIKEYLGKNKCNILHLLRDVMDAVNEANEARIYFSIISPSIIYTDGKGVSYIKYPFYQSYLTTFNTMTAEMGAAKYLSQYVSPEVIKFPSKCSTNADIYSFGCLLYDLATGKPPFVGNSAADTQRQHLYEKPDSVKYQCQSLPVNFARGIMKALTKDPLFRFSDVWDMFCYLSKKSFWEQIK